VTTLVGLEALAAASERAEQVGVRPPAVVVVGAVAAEGFIDDPACATEAGGA
jgi:uroporphyrin-III C-methyltransferase / precorrin-2 dehydrogenase / sirohydrochlorin ferrochelatase